MEFVVGNIYPGLLVDKQPRSFEVLADNEDGTYDVRWNDGDEEWNYVADLERYVKDYQEWRMNVPGREINISEAVPRDILGVTTGVNEYECEVVRVTPIGVWVKFSIVSEDEEVFISNGQDVRVRRIETSY